MAISKVDFGDRTLIDLTSDTVSAHSLKAGYTAHGADGEPIEGLLGKKLTFKPGSTLTLNVTLTDADGEPYSMAAGEVLKLHMWHGADTIDAESSTTELSVEVPSDAATRWWHWTLILAQSSASIMVALGDARCFEGGGAQFEVVGVVDSLRKVSATVGLSTFAYDGSVSSTSSYWFENLVMRTARLKSATSLGSSNFTKCAELRSLELPALTAVGDNVLNNCDKVECAEFPALKTTGNLFAYRCKGLKAIELPALTSLGHTAFGYDSSLRVIALPGDTMCTVAAKPLYMCPFFTSSRGNIGRIYVNDALVDDYKSATNWSAFADYIYPISEWDGSVPDSEWDDDSVAGGVFTSPVEQLLDGSVRGHVGSENITSLGRTAFSYFENIQSVDFPNVTNVGKSCFEGCVGLSEVALPRAAAFAPYVFSGCTRLARLDLPEIWQISYSFASYCTALTVLILRISDRVAQLLETTEAFRDTPIANGTGYIYVPRDLVDQYKAATNWSVFADQIRAIEDYPEICDPD